MRDAILYIRKSTKDKQANSFHIQLEAMKRYCDGSFNVTNIMQETGTGRRLDRTKLQETFNLLKSDKNKVVIFYKVDRYGRTLDDFKPLRSFIDRDQVRFMDLQSPESKADMFMIQMKIAIAEQESKLISERVKATYQFLESQGKGWGKSSEDMEELRKKAIETIKNNADNFGRAVQAYDLLMEKIGITTLEAKCKFLNETEAVKTPRGGKFTPSSYYRILKRMRARNHVV